MPRKPNPVPSYRLHKASGQAIVQVDGRRTYLGKWGTPASKEVYAGILAQLASQRREGATSASTTIVADHHPGRVTVVELLAAYWPFAQAYYTKDGQPSPWLVVIRLVIRLLKESYGTLPAADFGPLALKSFQVQLNDGRRSRKYINQLCAVVPRVWKWGASEQLVPASVYQSLRTVEGLRKGRTLAPERPPVGPVPEPVVEATLPYLPCVVADMVRFQRLTGARPGEVSIIRPCDVDRSGEVWEYRPESHKTEHHSKTRTIYIGPQAQDILRPYLLRPSDAYCFSPADSEQKRLAEMRAQRKSKVQPSQQDRSKKHPLRTPGDKYGKDAYTCAVRRAIDKANRQRADQGLAPLPNWHPNQLRHSAATEIRKQYGLEAAQVALGHAKADVTQVYAERDAELARNVMKQIG